nr:protein SUPPRESSOR OF GENE SILENCING 3 [Ipomoea batatas]
MMSSTEGVGKLLVRVRSTYRSVLDMAVHSAEEDGWEVYGHHKTWNNGGSRRGYVNSTDSRRPSSGGRENARFPPAIPPPLQHGWNCDEEFLSDDFDSDESEKSHETAKKNSWFKEFFDSIDSLSNEELNDPEKQWHYFACKGDLGAIEWFRAQIANKGGFKGWKYFVVVDDGMGIQLYADTSRKLHPSKFLRNKESWELLKRNGFIKESCCIELEKDGEYIAIKCGGLPLAEVAIVGVLVQYTSNNCYCKWQSIALYSYMFMASFSSKGQLSLRKTFF